MGLCMVADCVVNEENTFHCTVIKKSWNDNETVISKGNVGFCRLAKVCKYCYVLTPLSWQATLDRLHNFKIPARASCKAT